MAKGPFCFRVGNLVRYPVDELEAWKRANDARQPPTPVNDAPERGFTKLQTTIRPALEKNARR